MSDVGSYPILINLCRSRIVGKVFRHIFPDTLSRHWCYLSGVACRVFALDYVLLIKVVIGLLEMIVDICIGTDVNMSSHWYHLTGVGCRVMDQEYNLLINVVIVLSETVVHIYGLTLIAIITGVI